VDFSKAAGLTVLTQ